MKHSYYDVDLIKLCTRETVHSRGLGCRN